MLEIENVTQILRDNGFKVTPQRLAVYEALAATEMHPNAEMLYNILQPQYPTISLATVYKTMDIFAGIGLVQILNTGEDSFRYDANTSSHPHIKCICCNKVADIFDIDDEPLMKAAQEKTGFQLTGRQIYFYGKCPRCQKISPDTH